MCNIIYTHSLTNAAIRLELVLQDIADNIQIKTDFSLTHPQHQSIELETNLQQRFAQMPVAVQNNYLQVKLQQFLQHIYCVSRPVEIPETHAQIANQTINWDKSEFFQQLQSKNHSEGYFSSGWQIKAETADGFLQVQKNDLTLHVRRKHHLKEQEQTARVEDTVSIKLPPSLVEPGYYTAVGKAGSINDIALQLDKTIVDVYLNISSQGALALMDGLTARLNKIKIPFHFKVLYRLQDYVYTDTAVLSFLKDDSVRILTVIETVYRENLAYF